ncbi:vWA domain-containing protein [Hirschia litorea]|uniref:von Willebrand factor type A domain-containing protein n=1 Tax=Hirschia litorea TaxID=1199156 RepID=A0ABW2IJQ5_9PROT
MKHAHIILMGTASFAILAACSSQKEVQQKPPTEILEQSADAEAGPPAPPPPPHRVSGLMHSKRTSAEMAMASPAPMPTHLPQVDRDRYEDVDVNPVKLTSEDPVSTFSIDVDTASYSNVRSFLNDGNLPPKGSVRLEELINYFDYEYLLPESKEVPFSTQVNIVPSPWADGKQLMHVGIKGYDIDRTEQPPLNLTLLVDVSGSMNHEDKLPLAKKALKLLIDKMDDDDHISLVVYAGAAGTVLEPTKGSEKAKIYAALDNLAAGGSTAGGEGLRLAYSLAEQNYNKDGVNRVMLLTDGDFNVGVTSDERLEDFVSRKRDSGVYLSVLGFGRGNYNDAMMQKIAQAGNGMASYIDTLNEARKVLNDDLSGSMFTIANDVKIQMEFNPAHIHEYRLIGYETRMLNREDFNNDKVDAGDIGAGHTVTAIYEVTPVGSKAALIDGTRYGDDTKTTKHSDEMGYLKLRYKTPGSDTSKLIDMPIIAKSMSSSLEEAPAYVRFATAVAGFGQLLRQDPYLLNGFDYDSVISLANGAKQADEFGYRAEFVQLARAAKTAAAQETLNTGHKGGDTH